MDSVMHQRGSGKIKGVDNVYLATQWQMAPGGLPVAASAGISAVKLIGMKEKKKSNTRKNADFSAFLRFSIGARMEQDYITARAW